MRLFSKNKVPMEQIVSKSIISEVGSGTSFIEANTEPMSFDHIRRNHIIPVFSKDNEPLISQTMFISAVRDCVHSYFENEVISEPDIRVSHPIKGRVPNACHKPANQLHESEKTVYYERMIFKIDVPSIHRTIDGDEISLSIGGVKAYNLDSIGKDSRSAQHFKLFIGFKNTVCSNLCLWSDGSTQSILVTSVNDLYRQIENLIGSFEQESAFNKMKCWQDLGLTEFQFAQLLGRCRMYPSLPGKVKKEIFALDITDSQMMSVSRAYQNLQVVKNGSFLSLWQLYNLLTSSIKSSYIDRYLDRSVNSYELIHHLYESLDNGSHSWYLS